MNSKLVGVIFGISILTGLLVTGGFMYMWFKNPEFSGPPKEVPVTAADSLKGKENVASNDTIKETHTETATTDIDTKGGLSEFDHLRIENDRLHSEVNSLRDSLTKVVSSAQQANARVQQLDQSLANAQQAFAKERESKNDTTRLKNFRAIAEIYDKGQPAEIAKILGESDPDYVASILKLMKRKNAVMVLERLPTKQAVEVSKSLSRR